MDIKYPLQYLSHIKKIYFFPFNTEFNTLVHFSVKIKQISIRAVFQDLADILLCLDSSIVFNNARML